MSRIVNAIEIRQRLEEARLLGKDEAALVAVLWERPDDVLTATGARVIRDGGRVSELVQRVSWEKVRKQLGGWRWSKMARARERVLSVLRPERHDRNYAERKRDLSEELEVCLGVGRLSDRAAELALEEFEREARGFSPEIQEAALSEFSEVFCRSWERLNPERNPLKYIKRIAHTAIGRELNRKSREMRKLAEYGAERER